MASGDTLCVLTPHDNEPPASNNAIIDTRNGHVVLAFDDTTAWAAVFGAVMPRNYGGGGVTVTVHSMAATAVTGTQGWTVEFERDNAANHDLDADAFAAAQTITAAAVPGTSGQVMSQSVAVTNGANMDNIAAGDPFRLRLKRDVANDNAAGNAQVIAVEIKET